jgi:ABC-type branched-subunit amino acid transport system permease subunit
VKTKVTGLAFCIVLLGFLPYALPVTHVYMVIEIVFFSLFAVSYNMLFGYGGLLSFFFRHGL